MQNSMKIRKHAATVAHSVAQAYTAALTDNNGKRTQSTDANATAILIIGAVTRDDIKYADAVTALRVLRDAENGISASAYMAYNNAYQVFAAI